MPRDAAALLLATYGGDSAEGAIRGAVERLLNTAEVVGPPAPLELLGSLRGVVRIESVPISSAGRLVPVPGGGYVVQVNEADSPGRQRFSAAHEICHTFFDDARRAARTHDDPTIGAFDERRSEEYLCDLGAAHMLLHPGWLKDLAAGQQPSLDGLFAVASRCEASAEATARQLATLGVWRCSFVFWEPGYRKAERDLLARTPLPGLEAVAPRPVPRLRATRVYTATGMPFFPLRKSVGEDSSIAEALLSEGRTRGVERFDIGRQSLLANCESHYVGYEDGGGALVPRVLTLMRWREDD
jgi:hypothetical protein